MKTRLPTLNIRQRRARLVEYLIGHGGVASTAVARLNLKFTAHELSSVLGTNPQWADGWRIERRVYKNSSELELHPHETPAMLVTPPATRQHAFPES